MRTLLVWLLMVIVMSVYPFEGANRYPFADKVFHFILYGITCALFISVLRGPLGAKGLVFSAMLLVAVLAASLFGLLMEAVQGFIPGRHMSIWDVIANVLGAIAGAAYVGVKGKGP